MSFLNISPLLPGLLCHSQGYLPVFLCPSLGSCFLPFPPLSHPNQNAGFLRVCWKATVCSKITTILRVVTTVRPTDWTKLVRWDSLQHWRDLFPRMVGGRSQNHKKGFFLNCTFSFWGWNFEEIGLWKCAHNNAYEAECEVRNFEAWIQTNYPVSVSSKSRSFQTCKGILAWDCLGMHVREKWKRKPRKRKHEVQGTEASTPEWSKREVTRPSWDRRVYCSEGQPCHQRHNWGVGEIEGNHKSTLFFCQLKKTKAIRNSRGKKSRQEGLAQT